MWRVTKVTGLFPCDISDIDILVFVNLVKRLYVLIQSLNTNPYELTIITRESTFLMLLCFVFIEFRHGVEVQCAFIASVLCFLMNVCFMFNQGSFVFSLEITEFTCISGMFRYCMVQHIFFHCILKGTFLTLEHICWLMDGFVVTFQCCLTAGGEFTLFTRKDSMLCMLMGERAHCQLCADKEWGPPSAYSFLSYIKLHFKWHLIVPIQRQRRSESKT